MLMVHPSMVFPSIPGRLDRLTSQEFTRLLTFFIRARFGGALIMGTVALLQILYDPIPWKIALAAMTSLILLSTSVRDIPHLHAKRLSSNKIAQLLGTVMLAHATIIVLSGGIHSPFVVIFPAVSFLVALIAGRVRPAATVIGLAIAFVWQVAADDLIGTPLLLPLHFDAILPRPNSPLFALIMATLLTVALIATLVFGLVSRGAVERAIASAHDARTETLATMQDRNRDLWAMSGAVAHELKNPLASVRGLSSLLARTVEPGTKQAERMTVMQEEIERMGSIIDEFLQFSRPLSSMTRHTTDPATLLDKVGALHQPLAAAIGATLRLESSATGSLSCDPRKVTQVLANLLHNAIDASPRGGLIVLSLRAKGEQLTFEITDEGPGIDPSIHPQLFRPGTTTKPHGSGIGLAVARAIAEQHGGTLTLEGRPEGGCRATLQLPRSPVDEESA